MKKRISILLVIAIFLLNLNHCSFISYGEGETLYKCKSDHLMLFNKDLSVNKLNKVNFIENDNYNNYELEVYDKYIDEETGKEFEILSPNFNYNADVLEKYINKNNKNSKSKFHILDNKEYFAGEIRSFYNGADEKNISIECKYVGEHCTVWTDCSEGVLDILKLSSEKAKIIADYFDSKYNAINNMFGNYIDISKSLSNNVLSETYCGDADNDSKLAIVCYDIQDSYNKSNYSSYIGGYYNSQDNYLNENVSKDTLDEFSNYDESFSNMMDCINIDTFPGMGSDKNNPFSNVERSLSTLAHEYQHLIEASYIGEDVIFSKGKSLPPTFINEAFSMASEHLICGSDYTKTRIDRFNNYYEYGSSLTYWYSKDTDGDVLNNYTNSYMFGQYLRTRYANTEEAIQEGDSDGSTVYKKYLNYYSSIGAKKEDYYKYIEVTFDQTIEEFVIDFWKAVFKNKPTGNEGFNNEEWAKNIKPIEYVGGSINMASLPIKNGGIWFFKDCKGMEISKTSDYISIVELDDQVFSTKVIIKDNGNVIDVQENICDISEINWPTIKDDSFIGFYSEDDSLTLEETVFEAKRINFINKIYDGKEIKWYIDDDIDDTLNQIEKFSEYLEFRYRLKNSGPGTYTIGLPISPGEYCIKWSSVQKLYGLKRDTYLIGVISDNRHTVTYRQFMNNGDSHIGTEVKSLLASTEEEVIQNMPTPLSNIDDYTFIGWAGAPSKITEGDITLVTIYVKTSSIDFFKENLYKPDVDIIINDYRPDKSKFSYKFEDYESYINGLPPYDYGKYDVLFDTDDYLSGIDSVSEFGKLSFKVNVKVPEYYVRWRDFSGNVIQEKLYEDDIVSDIVPSGVEGYDVLGWFGDISKGTVSDADIWSVYRSKNLFKIYDGSTAEIDYNVNVEAVYITYKYDINKNKYLDTRCIGSLPTLPGIYYIESYVKFNGVTKKDSFTYEISNGDTVISFLDFYGNEFKNITVNSYKDIDLSSVVPPSVEDYKFIGYISNIYDMHDLEINKVKYQTVYVSEIVKMQKETLNFSLNIDALDTGYNHSTRVEYLYNNSPNITNDIGTHLISIDIYLLNNDEPYIHNTFEIEIIEDSFKVTFKNPLNNKIYKIQDNIKNMNEIIPPEVTSPFGMIFLGFIGEKSNEEFNDLTYNAVFINKNIYRRDRQYTTEELFGYTYDENLRESIYKSTYWEIGDYEYLDNNYNGTDFEYDKDGRKRKRIIHAGLPSLPGVYEITTPSDLSNYGFFEQRTFNISILFNPYKVTFVGLDGNTIKEIDGIKYASDIDLDIASVMDMGDEYPFMGLLEEIPSELDSNITLTGIYLKDLPKDEVVNKELNISTNIPDVDLEILYENVQEEGIKNFEIPDKSGIYNIYISVFYNDRFIGDYILNNINFRYKVKFTLDLSGGLLDSENDDVIRYIDDIDNISESLLPPGPVKKDYEFIGWYDEINDVMVDSEYLKNYIYNNTLMEIKLKALYKELFITIYRVYNPNSGEHLFTAKKSEYDKLEKVGWEKEGVTFDAYDNENAASNSIPLYRVYNPNGLNGLGDHHYTTKKSEAVKLVSKGWIFDNKGEPIFYVSGDIPVYRSYNSHTGSHHYTPKESEFKKLVGIGWIDEGIGWNVNGYYDSKGNRIFN